MKAVALDKPFTPVSITITIESEAEAGALFAIFNHTGIVDNTIGARASSEIRNAIESAFGRTPPYHGFHTKLNDRFKA